MPQQMTSFDKADFYCLKWIADDYEEISEIKECLARNDSINLSEEKIAHSLFKLISAKLAQAYKYQLEKQRYVEVAFSEEEFKGHWFYITKDGVNFLNQNRDKIGQ